AAGRCDMSQAAAVEVRDLFRVHRTSEGDAAALQGLTLRVGAGEFLAVLGPSGAGKSTLLRVLAGLETPSAGRLFVLGEDLGRLSAARRSVLRQRRLGLVDQHHDRALPAALDCRAAVGLALALRGEPRRACQARADALLDRVGLGGRGSAYPHELSGGERQRVAVCAALVHRPGLLLADEPGGELDAASAAAVYGLIAELAREEGATVVLVSHDRAVPGYADRTIQLRDGRVSDEAAGAGDAALVVDGSGWVRLPEALLRRSGVGARVRAEAGEGRIVLHRVAARSPAAEDAGDRRDTAPGLSPAPASSPPPAGPSVVRLEDVSRHYGTRAVLQAFTAVPEPARLTALSGRSGSGKSTVLRLLAGLERPDAGRVLVDNTDLVTLDRGTLAALRRARIGVVTQNTGLLDHLAARENVALALTVRGCAHAEAVARADAMLTSLGLAERLRQRTSRLSGGERQRVAIARGLVGGPGLLLVDEPTSRLDEANAVTVATLLAALARRHATTIVCATHDPIVLARCDAVVELGA
ncbi:MAG: hypothetical protein JWM31_3357, partial [Solirubrobacterales bacterium]|nr:hypothetical protein [Solirubrobacterales bacterium]